MNQKYDIIAKLGQGGCGNVYLVREKKNGPDSQNNPPVVIKAIPRESFNKYILSELRILNSLEHPRIIKFIDFFPTPKHYNFVMEWAKNGSLRHFITRFQQEHWKLAQKDLCELFMDIAYGISFLHSNNIIHRDVKPENILITKDNRAKIADFGVSKIVGDCLPNYHTSIGSLSYMSPEVYLQQPYDKSCDIWALGLILYELAMMKYPLTREDKCRILDPLEPYVCPKADWVRRKYDPRYQIVLEMMLQRDPRKRKSIDDICVYPLFHDAVIKLEFECKASNV